MIHGTCNTMVNLISVSIKRSKKPENNTLSSLLRLSCTCHRSIQLFRNLFCGVCIYPLLLWSSPSRSPLVLNLNSFIVINQAIWLKAADGPKQFLSNFIFIVSVTLAVFIASPGNVRALSQLSSLCYNVVKYLCASCGFSHSFRNFIQLLFTWTST